MTIKTLDATTGAPIEPATANTVIDQIFDAFKAPFMDQATEVMDADGVFWTAATWGLGGSVVGGLVTRKRINEEPIMKFLY